MRLIQGRLGGLRGPGILASAFLILILVVMSGCGRKAILSDDAVRVRKINDFVRELKDLYEQRDERLLTRFSPDYLTEIRASLQKDLQGFSTISLELFTSRIELSDGDVKISIHWNGIWKDAERTYREGGSMVLLASYGENIEITGILGNSPFGITSQLKNIEKDLLPAIR